MFKEIFDCPLCLGRHAEFFFHDTKNYQQAYHHCPACDLIFVAPEHRLNSNDEKSRYDMHQNGDDIDYVNFLSRLAQPMLQSINKSSEGLDFGSGRSQAMANLFRNNGHTCTCYDVFYYPDKSVFNRQYDFIVASEVIEHLYSPYEVIKQWVNLLKPTGFLGIMTGIRPENDTFPNWWYKNDPTHVSLFSHQTLNYIATTYHLEKVMQHRNVTLFKKINNRTEEFL